MAEEEKKQIQVKVNDDHKPSFANSAQINVADEEVVLYQRIGCSIAPIAPHTVERKRS